MRGRESAGVISMAGEGEDRFDGLLLRLAGEHTEGGITEVSTSDSTAGTETFTIRSCHVHFVATGYFLWLLEEKD